MYYTTTMKKAYLALQVMSIPFIMITTSYAKNGNEKKEKENVLITAIEEKKSLEEIKKILKEKPKLVITQYNNGTTPLERALWWNRTDIVQELLQRGAVVNYVDGEEGQTPLTKTIDLLFYTPPPRIIDVRPELTPQEKLDLRMTTIPLLLNHGASLYLGLPDSQEAMSKLEELRKEYKDTQKFRAHLPDPTDKKLNAKLEGYEHKRKISLEQAQTILKEYSQLPSDRYLLSLDDVITALTYKLPDAFLGGILHRTQFRTNSIAQPIIDYLNESEEKNFSGLHGFRRKMRILAALVVVRTSYNKDLCEQAQRLFFACGGIMTDEELTQLRCYYPLNKLNRYRDDRNKIKKLLGS